MWSSLKMPNLWLLYLIFLSFVTLTITYNGPPRSAGSPYRIPGRQALKNFPLIDGHNDLPHNIFKLLSNKITSFYFDKNLTKDRLFGSSVCITCYSDLPRIKEGKLGAQFWAAYVPCNTEDKGFIRKTLNQIDVIKRLIKRYPEQLQYTTTADGLMDAFANKKLAALIGVEGGHSIENQMGALRLFYELGVRYMTLTHTCNLPWADASPVDDNGISSVLNLTSFGQRVVLEMNRLGMMVDLSHVSHNVMSQAIDVSQAPVMFSHSSAFIVYPHHRNVRDDILKKVKVNGGIVMVNFFTGFVGDGNVTINTVVKHINHIVDIAGIDSVGIGSDFDGVRSVPTGLEDVSKFPDLFDLLRVLNPRRWTIANLEKLAGRNLYRVFKKVEEVREQLSKLPPDESLITDKEEILAKIPKIPIEDNIISDYLPRLTMPYFS